MKTKTAVKIPVIESERGWGRKVDDYMVCLTTEDATKFKEEFNSKNTSKTVPDWYMVVEGNPEPISLNESQMKILKKEKRVWLSSFKNILK